MKQLTVERQVDPFASHTARVDFKLGLNTYHRKKSIAEDGNG